MAIAIFVMVQKPSGVHGAVMDATRSESYLNSDGVVKGRHVLKLDAEMEDRGGSGDSKQFLAFINARAEMALSTGALDVSLSFNRSFHVYIGPPASPIAVIVC